MTAQETTRSDVYQIKFASLFDALTIYRLERAIFPRDAYGFVEILMLFLIPGLMNLKVVAPDGQLVGFASCGRLFLRGRSWIMTIGIHPDYQRQGLGRRLLDSCESIVRDRTIYLTVRKGNDRALDLYRMNGYRQVRVKRGYYGDGEDGIEMRKERDLSR